MAKKITVIGGADSLVNGNFSRKLEEHDVQVGWNYQTDKWDGKLAKGCEGVVVIIDMAGHGLDGKASKAATAAGIPFARITRKWSQSVHTLRVHGILDPVTNGETPQEIPREDLVQDGTGYLVRERQGGRLPSRAEVTAALRRAYGKGLDVTDDLFREMHSRACLLAANPLMAAKTEGVEEDGTTLLDWMTLVVEEDPGVMLEPDRAAKLAMTYAELSGRRDKALALQALAKIQALWGSREVEHMAWRNRLVQVWLTREFTRAKETSVLPSQPTLLQRGRAIFGQEGYVSRFIKQVRLEVLGDWADDLISMNQAKKIFSRMWKEQGIEGKTPDLKNLIKKGVVQGIKQYGTQERWCTSEKALVAYLDTLKPPASEEEPQEQETVLPDEPTEPTEPSEMGGLWRELNELHEKVAALTTLTQQLQEQVQRLGEEKVTTTCANHEVSLRGLMEIAREVGVEVRISPVKGQEGGS